MTPQIKLEHEIKVLEEARAITKSYKDLNTTLAIEVINALKDKLEALKKPKFRDGTLGTVGVQGAIMDYATAKSLNWGDSFEHLPIETILRHMAPEKAMGWEYNSKNSIFFLFKNNTAMVDDQGQCFIIPAPYRDDWQNVSGVLND